MQIGNIQQNQPNFKGSIYKSFIIDKSRASALKTIHNDVSKMLKDKPYDLYIEENYGPQTLTFSLKNSKDARQNYEVWVHHFMQKVPVLKDAVLGAMERFEQKFDLYW